MRSLLVGRIRLVALLVVLVAIVLIFRLYVVQIVRGEDFSERADHQYVRPQEGLFDRGSIFFQDKNGKRISAATVKSGFALVVNARLIEDPLEVYEELSSVVALDEEDFIYRASKKDDPYEVVSHRLTEEQADAIDALNIKGISLYKEHWRYYPGGSLAARVLGFVGYKGDELAGRYGIEREYENILSRDKNTAYVNFFAEVFSNIADILLQSGEENAGDVVLTIEPSVQVFLKQTLSDVLEQRNGKVVGGIIINPQDGSIYAMTALPSFDLNDFSTVSDPEIFNNPLVESIFEMGSIIKPLTMSIGLDTGSVTADTTYEDKGKIILSGYTISNYDGRARGVVSMQEVLNQSLNTGAAFVERQTGNKLFGEYMRRYGLGEKTGIDLPGEVNGFIENLKSPRDLEYATAAFGQGIAMTPIATTRALAALGNGGTLIKPHIVQYIDYDAVIGKKITHPEGRRVIATSTSQEITRMLVRVVDEALLGGTVKLDNYSIAAKTGTAQIPAPDGGYYDDRFLHSFFGYFPAYDPEFLVFLYIQEPKGVRYASETFTHPFMDIVKFLISYYEIPPDR